MLSISSVAGDVHGVRSSVGESLKEGEGLGYLVLSFMLLYRHVIQVLSLIHI